MGRAKRAAIGVTVFSVVVAVAIGGLFGVASSTWSSRREATFAAGEHDFPIPDLTDENRAEAERLYMARACGDCHAENGGGRVVIEAAPFRMVGPNITGLMRALSASDIHKIVRRGVRPDGSPIFFMPAHEYQRMPDRELGLITAHVRSLPQRAGSLPANELYPLGQALALLGVFETPLLPAEVIDQAAPFDPAGDDELGEYLVAGCRGCHGQTLSGGPIPGAPEEATGLPSNITPHSTGLEGWTLAQFTSAMREGRSPDRALNPDFMPFRVYRYLSDAEIEAMWTYLSSVERRPFGNR